MRAAPVTALPCTAEKQLEATMMHDFRERQQAEHQAAGAWGQRGVLCRAVCDISMMSVRPRCQGEEPHMVFGFV